MQVDLEPDPYAPLLLTGPAQLSFETWAYLVTHAGEIFHPRGPFLDVYGGTSAISNHVANRALVTFT